MFYENILLCRIISAGIKLKRHGVEITMAMSAVMQQGGSAISPKSFSPMLKYTRYKVSI